MTRAGGTTSFADFNARLRDHLEQSKATGRPLFVESDGRTDAVVLSPAAFDELMERAELAESLAVLDRSAVDIRAGRTRPAKVGIRQISEKLGLPLDRP
jgi:prevent-host-death family protein